MRLGVGHKVALLVTIVSMVACEPKTETKTEYVTNNDLRQFKDVNTQSSEVQKASLAVVKINTLGGSGTGTFVSGEGLLLTNDHVLGQDNCLKGGCFVSLIFNLQKNSDSFKTVLSWAEPVYVDTGADFHFVKMYSVKDVNGKKTKGLPLKTPNYLRVASDKALKIGGRGSVAEDYYVIGHPLGMLKKVLTTRVVKQEGYRFSLQKYLLPGNSGSALVNKNMEIVGVVHTSAFQSFAIAKNGIEGSAYGTHASRFPELNQLSDGTAGLRGVGVDKFKTSESLDPEDEEHLSYALALGEFPEQYPDSQELVRSYFEGCKEELGDIDFSTEKILLGEPEAPACSAMMALIQCEYAKSEAESSLLAREGGGVKHPAQELFVCPEKELHAKIQLFMESILKKRVEATGHFSVSEAESLLVDLYRSKSDFSRKFDKLVSQYLEKLEADFETMNIIYDSESLRFRLSSDSPLEMVRNFRRYPFYSRQAISILGLSAQLFGDQKITKQEMQSIWSQLKGDVKVTAMDVWIIDYVELLLADWL